MNSMSNSVSKAMASFDDYCGADDKSNNGFYIVFGIMLAVCAAVVILDNASFIGAEIMNNPLFSGI